MKSYLVNYLKLHARDTVMEGTKTLAEVLEEVDSKIEAAVQFPQANHFFLACEFFKCVYP